MNASIGTAAAISTIESWEEPQYSNTPTFAATVFTMLSLTVAAITAIGGWSYVTPVAHRSAPLAPAAAAQRQFSPETSLTYYIVGSEPERAFVRSFLDLATTDRAHGIDLVSESIIRQVATQEEEWLLLEEINEATTAWGAEGRTVRLLDLRK